MKETIANRIREGLKLRNMKQSELCKITGIGKSSISQYLSGDYEPKQQNIYLMAKALNVNEAWLMGYDVDYERKAENVTLLDDEQILLSNFNKLNNEGKKKLLEYSDDLICSSKYTSNTDYLEPLAAHGDITKNNKIDPRDIADMDNWE